MFPPDFSSRTRSLLGDEYRLLEAALQDDATVSVRINRDKNAEEPSAERVPWCETGYYLPERIAFTFDPLFHAGAYYVQEASSMFLEQVVKAYIEEPVRCLDLCAAPGGKSTHLCSILPANSLPVCNEVIRSRANILAENLIKWGNPNVVVTRNDPADFGRLTHFFDLIVVDAPCSGEGMFRKDPRSAGQWSLSNVTLCAARQRRILRDVWNALKPEGICIYSTCTYNTEENEENLAFLIEELGAEALPVPLQAEWRVTGALKYPYPAYRFFPHKTKGEGFFMAVVRKVGGRVGETPDYGFGKENRKKSKAQSLFPDEVKSRLLHPENFHIERRGNAIQAFPVRQSDVFQYLAGRLSFVSSGLCLGEIKGKDYLPAHALALSRELNRDSFAAIALSREEAILYLRKETLVLPGEKGYALVCYKDLPLGFVKRLENRTNNLYPQEWRIRHE
ncbi:MAG: RsmB/NOP family class I SAM-dependent RNA methyltransferase [Tannerellaceae bacterium]|jgi:16S rRNA C967 or C1407 C5-methylase (RsmB/RsmF family)/NOL1/NOP2/fmu family ribosome biogenesis protein|nr:RsmB/NOP family class I SAM-dependent RNA methyltransferase [Tannerellaceae bacterium]